MPEEELAPLTLDQFREEWRKLLAKGPPPRSRWLVAELDGEVIGIGGYAPTEHGDADSTVAELTILYVRSDRWRGGAGRALHVALTEAMRADGFTHAELWVFTANERGRRFYEAVGWEEEGSVGEWRGAAAVRYRTAL